ncbi:hypothetical protein AGMMS49991_05910 [Spirochaetia bacterium]|nr:hypothetical protein AGMMS49991_05910 [Spirochaetia bacterium]
MFSLKELIFNFLRNIYRKIIPSETRKKRWNAVHQRKIYKFNVRFIKYMENMADTPTLEEAKIISSIKDNPYIELLEKCRNVLCKWKFVKFLEKEPGNNNEKIEIIDFLRNNPDMMIPYNFIKKYNQDDIIVYSENNSKYVLHENKRMYFPKIWNDKKIQEYYNNLAREQDIDSPHRYEYGNIQVNYGDVVADIGAAEGFFALSVIEKVKKIFLFECDEVWQNALKMTFSPWKEKVVIVNKYVSDRTEGNFTTMDHCMGGQEINFIKADIEGAEPKFLKGARRLLTIQKNIKLSLCVYHNKNDARQINRILLKNNFHAEFSKGYIISIWEKKYSLRKGVIRGYK